MSAEDIPELNLKDIVPYAPNASDDHVDLRLHDDIEVDIVTFEDLFDIDIAYVLDKLALLYNNGITDIDRLTDLGLFMTSLMYHGGMTPSEAIAYTVKKFLGQGRNLEQQGDLVGMSKGGFWTLNSKSAGTVSDAHRLHYMTRFAPMIHVFTTHLAAEVGDYEERYILLRAVDPDDSTESTDYNRDGPTTVRNPPDPQYALITESWAPSLFNPNKEPSERSHANFMSLDVAWYVDDDELVEDLWESRYFETHERAAYWDELLTSCGFSLTSTPLDRINPDKLLEEAEAEHPSKISRKERARLDRD